MSAAPGVLVEFRGACPLWTAATRGFAACCASGLFAWAGLHHFYGQDPGVAWLATGLCAASVAHLACLLFQPAPQGRLVWNTQAWSWQPSASPSTSPQESGRTGSARIALDLGGWVLLRFDSPSPSGAPTTFWLPLSRARAGGAWHALQCALRQPSAGLLQARIVPTPRMP